MHKTGLAQFSGDVIFDIVSSAQGSTSSTTIFLLSLQQATLQRVLTGQMCNRTTDVEIDDANASSLEIILGRGQIQFSMYNTKQLERASAITRSRPPGMVNSGIKAMPPWSWSAPPPTKATISVICTRNTKLPFRPKLQLGGKNMVNTNRDILDKLTNSPFGLRPDLGGRAITPRP